MKIKSTTIDAMVQRFLAWPIPQDFGPDCGISFDGRKDDGWNKNKTWPVGTNLFSAEQARAMFEHALVGDNADADGPMDFGDAIRAMKAGKRVARAGWDGKGMYLWLMPAATIPADWCKEPHLKELAEANGGSFEMLGVIRMKTADNKVLTGWLASQTDMLADDWVVVA